MSHDIRPNAFTENLGTDILAVDDSGRVLCRAHDLDAAMRAAPAAKAYLTASDIAQPTPAPEGLGMSPVGAELKMEEEIVDAEAAKAVADPAAVEKELAAAKAQIAKMDPDGDGKIGGAPKGGNRKKGAVDVSARVKEDAKARKAQDAILAERGQKRSK